MAFILSKKKEILKVLASELGLIIEAGLTKHKLKDIIVKSPDFLRRRGCQKLTFLPKKDWVQKLIGLIPIDVAHLIVREPADKCNDYDHVKDLLLKRFKLSPEELRQLFISHQKCNKRTWQDFHHELQTYFDGWTSGLKIVTFDQLRELIIANQMKKNVSFEFQVRFLDEWATNKSPAEIAEEFEEYEDVRRILKPISYQCHLQKEEMKRETQTITLLEYPNISKVETIRKRKNTISRTEISTSRKEKN
ncbi:transposon Tf2-6 polyprotein [Trichonephila clavipes]|nr:transposon Tf2-6 polyprotein [Trichonephila clavipes]